MSATSGFKDKKIGNQECYYKFYCLNTHLRKVQIFDKFRVVIVSNPLDSNESYSLDLITNFAKWIWQIFKLFPYFKSLLSEVNITNNLGTISDVWWSFHIDHQKTLECEFLPQTLIF